MPDQPSPPTAVLNTLPKGLLAVTGGEQTGKTAYLRNLAEGSKDSAAHGLESAPSCVWVDLSLPDQDQLTPVQWWATWQARSPLWNAALHTELVAALALLPHADKQLFMLSTGSRRKVAIAALLACGATVTCLDQPYAALDGASIHVIREFLHDMADHPQRTWVVADYEADPRLPWAHTVSLD